MNPGLQFLLWCACAAYLWSQTGTTIFAWVSFEVATLIAGGVLLISGVWAIVAGKRSVPQK